jgi:hypothetical protein
MHIKEKTEINFHLTKYKQKNRTRAAQGFASDKAFKNM